MALDIQTRRGEESVAQERRAIEIFTQHHRDIHYVETPKDEPAFVDAILARDMRMIGVVEQKSRDMPLDTLASWGWEWLVTKKKVTDGRQISMGLRVPFVGFLYLVTDDLLLVRRLFNADGSVACRMRSERRETQATINGGVANRENAMIDMSEATWYTMHDTGSVKDLGY